MIKSLIANTGIQMFTMPIEIDMNTNFKMNFHQWFDTTDVQLKLEYAYHFNDENVYVKTFDLFRNGYLDGNNKASKSWNDIDTESRIDPLCSNIEDPTENGIYSLRFNDNKNKFNSFINKWLPFPYFEWDNINKESIVGPFNWCRCKLISREEVKGIKRFDMLLAFDTRTLYSLNDSYNQQPTFTSNFDKKKTYTLCNNEFKLLEFFSPKNNCEWVDLYLMKLVYPNINKISDISDNFAYSYLASYILLINYLKNLDSLPQIQLYSDNTNIIKENVQMVIDVGNSRTSAILFEDNDFTKVKPLQLQNFTNPIIHNGENSPQLNHPDEAFDMRLAFRKASFGDMNVKGNKQFTWPSMIRLGEEANYLIHQATNVLSSNESVSTYSSPKRYLWDIKPRTNEWEFVQLNGEEPDLPQLDGISEQFNDDGTINWDGRGGEGVHYSRQTLMVLSFIEIISQAFMQINSDEYREFMGKCTTPRRIDRIIITCPTAMSNIEQKALRKCMQNAVIILRRFYLEKYSGKSDESLNDVTIIPKIKQGQESSEWIYDEATCSQFVYLYAKICNLYANKCEEFITLYGHATKTGSDNNTNKTITIGSLDIGAGTSDMMICEYSFLNNGNAILKPHPLYWDSFYYAGDDMMKNLVENLIIEGKPGSIAHILHSNGLEQEKITSLIYNFFGADHNELSFNDRILRRDFNLQVSVPIVTYFLELLRIGEKYKILNFNDIFKNNKPNDKVLKHFETHFGIDLTKLIWTFNSNDVAELVEKSFYNLLRDVATLMFAYKCDIVLLSGKPTSLYPIKKVFLEYYPVTPDRLVLLNNYRIGRWYPFQDGNGYLENSKSIVPIGAMIGYQASTLGGLNGFTLDLSELGKEVKPTTEYFMILNNRLGEPEKSFISPEINNKEIPITNFPTYIGCKQFPNKAYPTRPFYILDIDRDKIRDYLSDQYYKKTGNKLEGEALRLAIDDFITNNVCNSGPWKFTLERENYPEDKEKLSITSAINSNNDDISSNFFSLQVQSLNASDGYWLDTGEFNVNITARNN